MNANEVGQALTIFFDWVKALLPSDKYAIFLSLFQFPTPIVELTETAFHELERVFDGKNPVANYQFTNPTYRDDWEWYRQNILKESTVWREKAWTTVKTSINSILIIDLPKEQEGPYPEPYAYFLGIENVIDFSVKEDGIEWIIFKQKDDIVACFDDEYYRTFKIGKKGQIENVVEVPHDLGYCPARFFWTTPLNNKYPEVKKSPISSQLGNLNWLLYFEVSKKHLDLYAAYPIYTTYAADCTFKNPENGDMCDGGFLRQKNKQYKILAGNKLEPCPVCSTKRMTGVGSVVELPIPTANQPELTTPVGIVTIDKASLDYNVGEIERLQTKFIKAITGIGGILEQKNSINEMQVQSNFESKISILNSLKGNIERAWQFKNNTICRLRYGANFLDSSISLGTEFYIYSVEDLYKMYKLAKENGASEIILDAISVQIIETEYRNDPQQMQRILILKHLEPYRHYTLNELMTLFSKSLLNKDLLVIKLNFSAFVDRFERENQTNIIEFGSQLDFDNKIQIINTKFLDYVREQQLIEPAPEIALAP